MHIVLHKFDISRLSKFIFLHIYTKTINFRAEIKKFLDKSFFLTYNPLMLADTTTRTNIYNGIKEIILLPQKLALIFPNHKIKETTSDSFSDIIFTLLYTGSDNKTYRKVRDISFKNLIEKGSYEKNLFKEFKKLWIKYGKLEELEELLLEEDFFENLNLHLLFYSRPKKIIRAFRFSNLQDFEEVYKVIENSYLDVERIRSTDFIVLDMHFSYKLVRKGFIFSLTISRSILLSSIF